MNRHVIKKIFPLLLLVLAISATGLSGMTGCCAKKHEGVEAGNPNVIGQQLRITPREGDEEYLVTFVDEDLAMVDQILLAETPTLVLSKAQTVLQRVTVPYQIVNNVLTLSVSFSNGRQLNLSAEVSEASEVVQVTLEVDGSPVAVDFFASGNESETGSAAASLILSDFSHASDLNKLSTRAHPVLPKPKGGQR